MRKAILALAATTLTAAPALAAPPGWLGRYVYEQSLGRGPGGDTPFISHVLTLGPKHCALDTEGFQVFEHIICDVQWRGDAVTVTFVGFDNRNPDANLLVAKHYRPGEPLFTLTKTPNGLMTRWLDYARAPKGPKSGRYFR